MNFFMVVALSLATLACADVSHLSGYNYAATRPVNFAPLKSQPLAQIESIKPSLTIASFSIQQNVGKEQSFGSQSYSSGQNLATFNNNAPVQQHTYSTPESLPVQQSYHKAAPVNNAYLPPAPQKQQYAALHHVHESTFSAPAEQPSQEPAVALVHNDYLPPTPASAPALAVAPVVQQTYSAPAVQSYTAPVSVPQQQSYEISEQQQQSFGGVAALSGGIENVAHNYQANVQQENFPAIQQTFSNTGSATSSFSSNNQQLESHSISGAVESGSHNCQSTGPVQQTYSAPVSTPVQQSYSAPAEETYSAPVQQSYSAPVQQSFSAPVQQSYSAPVQQTYSAPVSTPVQQSYSAPAEETYSAPVQQSFSAPVQQSFSAPVQQSYSAPIQQTYSAPVSIPVQQSYSAPAEETYSAPVQQSFSAPVQQSYSAPVSTSAQQTYSAPAASNGVESGSFNYQPAAAPIQQSYSAPALNPQHQTLSTSTAVDTGSHNYQPAYLNTNSFTPTVSAIQTPEVGTVYGSNGGYVYSKQ